MQTVLQALNLPCDPQMVEATLAVADLDGNGTLDYAEFVTFVCQARGVGGNGNGNGEEDQLLETFGLFDKDGDGKLGPADLMTALSDQVYVHKLNCSLRFS
jgi:Ca2+-binding EF-hand superfamily protein